MNFSHYADRGHRAYTAEDGRALAEACPYNPARFMALTPGTRLGPYEITAQIGVGGMEEVYRATDTKLKRDVAVKVLPAAWAAAA